MDLTWKIFFCPKKSKISTFHFLNLSPALPNFGASYLQTDWYRQATVFTEWFFLTLVLIWSWSHIHEKPWDVQYFDRQQSFTRVSQWKHFSKMRSPIEALGKAILTSKYEPPSSNHWPDIWNWILQNFNILGIFHPKKWPKLSPIQISILDIILGIW